MTVSMSILFWIALVVTIAVEVGIVMLLNARNPTDRRMTIVAATALNLVTLPLVWAGGLFLPEISTGTFLVTETAVTMAEAAGYAVLLGWSIRRSVAFSFLANVATASLGILGASWI